MNLNQKELAKKTNITEASLSRYENDIRESKVTALIQLAKGLNVSTDYLLGLTENMKEKSNDSLDKSDKDFEEIYNSIKLKLESGRVTLNGEIACKEAIDSMLKAMRMGMLLALEEQKKQSRYNY